MTTYASIKSGEAAMPATEIVLSLDIDLSDIRLDQSAQPRESLNNDRIAEYAEAMKAGDEFPPLTVFNDGKTYWLADGFHRHYAAQHAGRKHIRCHVRKGGLRDAILYSVGANAKHGLARSDEDKRRAVARLLTDEEWSKWSDREIARRCLVGNKLVGDVRRSLTVSEHSDRAYRTKHGTVATMKTAGINASRQTNATRPSINDEPSPEAGPQAEASLAGTGTGMPADREGRHEGEAASVDLPTISDAERDADTIQSAWDRACEPGRALFLAANNLQFQAKSSEDNGGTSATEGAPMAGEVSRVSVGTETDVDGGRRVEAFGGAAPVITNSKSDGDGNALTVFPSPSVAVAQPQGPRRNATAKVSRSVPPPPPGETEKAGEAVPPPSASPATQFNNPRCLNPETCFLAHSRDCCFDCSVAWAQRPKEEQIRLWAEANEASA